MVDSVVGFAEIVEYGPESFAAVVSHGAPMEKAGKGLSARVSWATAVLVGPERCSTAARKRSVSIFSRTFPHVERREMGRNVPLSLGSGMILACLSAAAYSPWLMVWSANSVRKARMMGSLARCFHMAAPSRSVPGVDLLLAREIAESTSP